MKANKKTIAAILVACTFVSSAVDSLAQDNAWSGATGNWTDGTWTLGGAPAFDLDGQGIVGWNDPPSSGSASAVGVVSVTTNVTSPTVIVGLGGGATGTLNISAGGDLSVVPGLGPSSGNLSVGLNGGVGTLNVNGTLSVQNQLESLNIADGTSTTTLSGTATVTAASGFLDRQLVIDGSNVNATFTNDLILGSSGTHTWKIPAAGPSTLKVGGNADLGGLLQVEFTDGAPALGSTWNLIDSGTVDAFDGVPTGFTAVDQIAVSSLPVGATLAVNTVAGGTNGNLTQLALEQHPVLVIDRQTGATSIQNFSGSASTVSFDAYVVGSLGSHLNPAAWTSIDPSNGWVEGAARPTALSELNPTSAESIGAASSIGLGTPFLEPSAFDEDNQDITFQFAKDGESVFTDGTIIYTGASTRTLTLNVDPTTGEAQLVNGTSFTVSIDEYHITSASGSLDVAGWNSLDDQGTSVGNWYEANSGPNQLAELLAIGGMKLAPNSILSLGDAFTPAAMEDLQFKFLLVDNSAGDFDGDGDIDGADFLKWQRDGLSASDLVAWQAGYGSSSTAGSSDEFLTGDVLYSPLVSFDAVAATAVPEPTSTCLVVVALLLLGTKRRGSLSPK